MQNGYAVSLNGRMRDEVLNKTLFLSLAHARVDGWVEHYNQYRPPSSLGYETPAAYAVELERQWPTPLRPTGPASQPIAAIAPIRNKPAWL